MEEAPRRQRNCELPPYETARSAWRGLPRGASPRGGGGGGFGAPSSSTKPGGLRGAPRGRGLGRGRKPGQRRVQCATRQASGGYSESCIFAGITHLQQP